MLADDGLAVGEGCGVEPALREGRLRTRAAAGADEARNDVAEPDFCGRSSPAPTTASTASDSTSASAASLSARPKDSMPACTNSPGSPARSRNTGPQ